MNENRFHLHPAASDKHGLNWTQISPAVVRDNAESLLPVWIVLGLLKQKSCEGPP